MRSVLNPKTTLIGGALAGMGASVCCVGPFLLLSMGIGGAWIVHLTALEPYRPLFIVLTALFLGWTFWKLYLAPQSCAVGDDCIADRPRKVQRILFWMLLPVVLLLVVSPWILPLFYR
jgi:mercuric ion transport protein